MRAVVLLVVLSSCSRRRTEETPKPRPVVQEIVVEAGTDAADAETIEPVKLPPAPTFSMTLEPFPSWDDHPYPDWSELVVVKTSRFPAVSSDGKTLALAWNGNDDGLRSYPAWHIALRDVDTDRDTWSTTVLEKEEIEDLRRKKLGLPVVRARVKTRLEEANARLAGVAWHSLSRCVVTKFPTEMEEVRQALLRNDPQVCTTADFDLRFRSLRLSVHAGKGGPPLLDVATPSWQQKPDAPVNPADPSAGFLCNYAPLIRELHYDRVRAVLLVVEESRSLGITDACTGSWTTHAFRL